MSIDGVEDMGKSVGYCPFKIRVTENCIKKLSLKCKIFLKYLKQELLGTFGGQTLSKIILKIEFLQFSHSYWEKNHALK